MNEERKEQLLNADAMITESRNLLQEIYDEEDKNTNFISEENSFEECEKYIEELIKILREQEKRK